MIPNAAPRPQGRPSLTHTEQKAIEEVNFLRRHPEMHNYIGMLLSAAVVCIDSKFSLPNIVLEDAYQHVFGGGCAHCRRTFDLKKEMHAKFYEKG